MNKIYSPRSFMLLGLVTAGSIPVEDKAVVKANPKYSPTLDYLNKKNIKLDELKYKPVMSLTFANQVTWMTGIATLHHKKIYSKIKRNRSVFKFEDGGEVAIDSNIIYE